MGHTTQLPSLHVTFFSSYHFIFLLSAECKNDFAFISKKKNLYEQRHPHFFYLAEVHVDVFSGFLVKLCATNLLCKAGDANGVAGVKLLDKEITASLDHTVYLVHDGAVHHVDHTLLPYGDAGGVGKLYESLHYLSG